MYILGIDPGMRNTGFIIRKNKTILKANCYSLDKKIKLTDNYALQEYNRAVHDYLIVLTSTVNIDVAVIEVPHGAQSYLAAKSLFQSVGVIVGILAVLKIETKFVSPFNVKKQIGLKKFKGKDPLIDYTVKKGYIKKVEKKYVVCNTVYTKQIIQHIADAIVISELIDV